MSFVMDYQMFFGRKSFQCLSQIPDSIMNYILKIEDVKKL
jgi:hypothetical protein